MLLTMLCLNYFKDKLEILPIAANLLDLWTQLKATKRQGA